VCKPTSRHHLGSVANKTASWLEESIVNVAGIMFLALPQRGLVQVEPAQQRRLKPVVLIRGSDNE
jgi:hypothetical protein